MTAANIAHIEEFIAPENLSSEPAEKVAIRKQLAKWISAKEPHAEILTITPEMAQIMLERNVDNNRAQSGKHVGNYRREMRDNRMILTNQGIGFDTNGRLIDGQHRLLACISLGKPFQSLVVFGLDPEAFMFVDSGYKRTPGHKVGMAGFSNQNNLAAAARIVLIHDLMNIDLGGTSLGVLSTGAHASPPDEFIVDFCRETPDFVALQKWYGDYRKFPPIKISTFHAAHWLIAQKHPKLADAFIEQLCYGEGLKRTENVYRLREHLLALYVSKERMPKAWQLCWIIDGFNDTRRGKTTKFIMTAGRDFPKVLS